MDLRAGDIKETLNAWYAASVKDADDHLSVVVVGGAAFQLLGLTKRNTTHDIDILVASESMNETMPIFKESVNDDVSVFMDSLPYNFEDRLTKFDTGAPGLTVYIPSIEDLAVMKLYGMRPNDEDDLTSEAFLEKIDWDQLDYLVYDENEAAASQLSNRRLKEMRKSYEAYRREHWHGADLEVISRELRDVALGNNEPEPPDTGSTRLGRRDEGR